MLQTPDHCLTIFAWSIEQECFDGLQRVLNKMNMNKLIFIIIKSDKDIQCDISDMIKIPKPILEIYFLFLECFEGVI